ncbi:MAG: DUF1499 domain-containing protein [Nocardioides sp.]|uniref:DUF1499 domain-containing protein n=1 Tax=Nocardioides sp. TaxID=35761 RepID=UPI002394BCA8|nr:DUF1499 domain-containing protein [Nocardioides sp.]MDE0777911.1 DUF1499 domain-containing protein [Nocardioides sp.]
MPAKRITPCPEGSQKCVSTLDTQKYCAMEPVPFTGTPDQARVAVLQVIAEFPRTAVVEDDGGYVKAIFKTKVIRFKDTVEFEVDAEDNLVHFRSESVPYAGSDLGANRKRMTVVRANLVAALAG